MDENLKADHRRWLQHARFRWHEAVLNDPIICRHRSAIALAGHVMHRYDPQRGFAQFSIASAAKVLRFSERSLKRAKKLLIKLGWIRLDERAEKRGPGGWRANRYILSGGPDDLLFDARGLGAEGDTGG